MSASVSDQELGDSLLHSVKSGSFPQSEHLASAPVGSEALPKLRQTLEKARDDTKVPDNMSCSFLRRVANRWFRSKSARCPAKPHLTSMAG